MSGSDAGVSIADDLVSVVRLGVLRINDVSVRMTAAGSPEAEPDLEAAEAVARDRLTQVRAMYRHFGVDPTKTRPSSEALLRRLRRGLPWPRINSLVDIGNRCSLETQLPFGLYDAERVASPVVLRRGGPGDEYVGIGKPIVHLTGRPTLFDGHGPFGNPTSDYARTMVTTSTSRALVVVYGPHAIERADLDTALELTASRLRAHGATEEGRWVVPCA